MIKRLICILTAAISIFTSLPGDGVQDIVRLHIVAQSDSAADQAYKLRVRADALDFLRTSLPDCNDNDALFWALEDVAQELEIHLNSIARLRGMPEDISVETGHFAFDDREYMGMDVPAGEYRAMRILIGSAEGHNWWCIMFPGLWKLATGQDGEVEYYSALIRWLRQLFG